MKKFPAAAILMMLATSMLPVAAQAKEPEPPVRVFDAGELTLSRYTVVKRLWTGTWRSAFWIPEQADAGAAISALTAEARNLGADGVVNLHCMNDAGGWGSGYLCYGLAIKLK